MVRIVLGVIAGFFGWLIGWLVSEKIISAIWPAFGTHQRAFEEATKNGGAFTADNGALITHIVLGTIASLMAGALAAIIAVRNTYAPLIGGCLLLAMGIAKAAMSWQLVPIWYHIIFTAMLLPLTIVGGKLISTT
jgi:hypothetical protein